jgi:hypothetical protein
MSRTAGYAAHGPTSPLPSHARCRPTSRSTSSSAASATPTCTRCATSGAPTVYPCVPGHEIVGRVATSARGDERSRPATSSASAAWSTRAGTCPAAAKASSSTATAMTFTYNSPTHTGGTTYGGYSTSIVVDEAFVLRMPKNLDLAARRPAALRRHHDLLAAAPLERRDRAARSASSASAASGTWASSSPTRWAPTTVCSRPRRRRLKTRSSAPTRS